MASMGGSTRALTMVVGLDRISRSRNGTSGDCRRPTLHRHGIFIDSYYTWIQRMVDCLVASV
jgi:hypothetical protein